MSNQSDTSHHLNAQARVYQPNWMIPSHRSQISQLNLHTCHECYEEPTRQYRGMETSGMEQEDLGPERLLYLAEEDQLDRSGMEQRNHNGLGIEGGAPQTASKKVSFKQILEKAMNNVSDQLMALLEEELDNMEEESEEMEEELTSTQRDSKL